MRLIQRMYREKSDALDQAHQRIEELTQERDKARQKARKLRAERDNARLGESRHAEAADDAEAALQELVEVVREQAGKIIEAHNAPPSFPAWRTRYRRDAASVAAANRLRAAADRAPGVKE